MIGPLHLLSQTTNKIKIHVPYPKNLSHDTMWLKGASMKKIDVVNLIRFHLEGDEEAFNRQALAIADDFNRSGDSSLSSFVESLIYHPNTFSPQSSERTSTLGFLTLRPYSRKHLYLPEAINRDILGIVNACQRGIGVNCFLFYGAPGTGKTEAVSEVARLLKRDLWYVNIAELISSRLGETSKNIATLFDDISSYSNRNRMLVLFDEIDALSLNRDDERDLREMARATTSLFKGLDEIDENVVVIATTNLYKHFDKALLRRFSAKIDFNRYSREDLVDIAVKMTGDLASTIPGIEFNSRSTHKLFSLVPDLPSPGELKNLIKKSIAFSSLENPYDYMTLLFKELYPNANPQDLSSLAKQGFSYRDMEMITGRSKSDIGRALKNG